METPRVSVIVTCYNLGEFLDEAVDSVLTQSFQDFEILIVDDGSSEPETRRKLSSYNKPKTRVVRSENRGLPGARNLGVAQTTGPYVCTLDADDLLDRSMLEKSVAALDGDPSIAFVSHWFRTFGDETWEWTPTEADFPALLHENTLNGAALVRRSALEAVGGFDETFRDGCEDWDLWITMVERGFRGRILPEFLFHYRRRKGSMSRVMMEDDDLCRLYHRLAEKHPQSFRTHARALLLKREQEVADLRLHIDRLEREYYQWLGPEVMKQRDDVAVFERKAAQYAEQRRLETALENANYSADAACERALELDRTANRALEEIAALRRSVSWRITAPLRGLYERVWLRGKA